MFDPYRIGYKRQNYYYRKKGQILRKKYFTKPSFYFPTKPSELNELLPLMYKYQLLSPLTDEPPDPSPDPDPPTPPTPPPPPPSPDPELIAKTLTTFALRPYNTRHLFITNPDLKMIFNDEQQTRFLYFQHVFIPNLPVVTIPYKLWARVYHINKIRINV